MTAELRVVVDTNVLISQLLRPQSQPSEAVRLVLRKGVLLTSAEHLRELFDVVMRPKFDAYVAADVRLVQIRRLAALAEPVPIVRRVRLCRDAKDDMLLEIAANGGASHLVNGDSDLLGLDPFEGVRIVTPSDFLRLTSPLLKD
jgi:putative PIN family toxin of toxin-antitoxin system